jgi:hypothetical protein
MAEVFSIRRKQLRELELPSPVAAGVGSDGYDLGSEGSSTEARRLQQYLKVRKSVHLHPLLESHQDSSFVTNSPRTRLPENRFPQ